MSELDESSVPDTIDGEDAADADFDDPDPGKKGRTLRIVLRTLFQIAIAAGLIFAGLQISKKFQDSAPDGPQWGGGGPPRNASFVEAMPVEVSTHGVQVDASGTVVPAEEIALYPQVSGEIREVAPTLEPGGLVRADEQLVRLDDRDYRIAVQQAEAQRDIARASIRLEEANQEVARTEFELFGEGLDGRDEGLMLREPQLAQAEASLESAEAALDRARLDRSRTRIDAPFDALVQRRAVNVGSRVTPGTELAYLIGTDRFWIEVSVPVDVLRHIDVPGPNGGTGSIAHVYHEAAWGQGVYREARVVRQSPALEEGGRLARVLVEIDDPLSLLPENADVPRVMLNAWVRVLIEGHELQNVVAVDRDYLRNGDQVWVMTADNTLDIRDVDITFRRRDDVLVGGGLEPGESIVTNDIPTPVQGMTLRTRSDEAEAGGMPGGRPDGPPRAGGSRGRGSGGSR